MSSYNKRTKIFFGVMAFLLVVGYPLSLLGSFSGFTSLFTSGSGSSDPKGIIASARKDIKAHPNDKSRVALDLRKMGVSYEQLASPDASGVTPSDSAKNLSNAIDAFTQWTKLDPKSTDAAAALAGAYSGNQNYAKAEQIYGQLGRNTALINQSDYIYAWASAAQQANDTATALTAYAMYLKVDPTGTQADTVKQAITALKTSATSSNSSTSAAAAAAATAAAASTTASATTSSTTATKTAAKATSSTADQTSTSSDGTVTVG